MRLDMIGLGPTDSNTSLGLIEQGFDLVDSAQRASDALAAHGERSAASRQALSSSVPAPRMCSATIPAGTPTGHASDASGRRGPRGEMVIDGGYCNSKSAPVCGKRLAEHGIHFLDTCTSGGIWGREAGSTQMDGGSQEAVTQGLPARVITGSRYPRFAWDTTCHADRPPAALANGFGGHSAVRQSKGSRPS